MIGPTKYELANVPVAAACCRRAEAVAMLRFAGAVSTVGGRPVVEVHLDTQAATDRLCATLREAFYREPIVTLINGRSRGHRYIVRIIKDAEVLIRQAELVDRQGLPVIALPPIIAAGRPCDTAAAWRGAILAAGARVVARRKVLLEVQCPTEQAAVALAGLGMRLGAPVKVAETRGRFRVVVRGFDATSPLLARLGARDTLREWADLRPPSRSTAWTENFGGANSHRATSAASETVPRVRQALEVLGDNAPQYLITTAELRVAHEQASLLELAQMHSPALSKAAVAGRLRRIVALAAERSTMTANGRQTA